MRNIIVRATRFIVSFFSVFADISNVLLDPNSKELLTSATIGKSIELKCDIHGGTDILWKRNGVELTTDTKGLTVSITK